MAITVTCHVESIAGSGAASIVVTCQRVEEPHGIRHRKWSRVVAITVACQGVMELCEIHRRKWSGAVAIAAACQGVQAYRSEFGWSVWRREVGSHPSERSSESGSRRSPEGVFLQSKSEVRSGSRRSSDEVFLRLKSGTKPSSRRSSDGVFP